MDKTDGQKEQELIKVIDDITDRLVKVMDVIYHVQEELNSLSEEVHELLRQRLKRNGQDRR